MFGFTIPVWVWVIAAVALVIAFHKPILALFGVILVSEDRIGIVTKKFRLFGEHTTLPDGAIIALNKEAGVQADTLAPGLHLGYWPWQFKVEQIPFVTIPEGKVGFVTANDGGTVPKGRTFASSTECDSFQNARQFLTNGGQRGPQLEIIRPGTYRINLELFNVKIYNALRIADDQIGLVTTNDGLPLSEAIAGPIITGHDKWQNPQKFIDNGGYKGRQEEIIPSGTYYVNPEFVTVETTSLFEVPVGYVGVVNSFVGDLPEEQVVEEGGERDMQARIVKQGQRGVWEEVYNPGRYQVNTYIQRVELVPTTNIVLNWASEGKNRSQELDGGLSTIRVRSSDGFSFNLDVSQIIHISPYEASRVIARFGTMKNLVTQVLEPLIGNYFRNAAQSSDAIDFLKNRTEKQAEAKAAISEAISRYSVHPVDTLIGDINPPEELMKPLTDKKIAEQQVETYKQQETAEQSRMKFQTAAANADTARSIVEAKRSVEIATSNAAAAIENAKGDAESRTIIAQADAKVLIVTGEAQAKNTRDVGMAEAEVIKAKVDSVGADQYSRMAMIDALSAGEIKIVPDVMVSGGTNSGPLDALLGMSLVQAMNSSETAAPLIEATAKSKK